MTTAYDIGDQPTVVATFVDVDGVASDPSAITFEVKDPAGTITTESQADATNPSVGTWHWTLPAVIDAHGLWHVRVAATGGLICAGESKFRVRDSAFD